MDRYLSCCTYIEIKKDYFDRRDTCSFKTSLYNDMQIDSSSYI